MKDTFLSLLNKIKPTLEFTGSSQRLKGNIVYRIIERMLWDNSGEICTELINSAKLYYSTFGSL